MKVGVVTKLSAITVIASLLLLSGGAFAQTNVRITVVDSTNNIEAGGNVTYTFLVENLAAQNLTYDLFASGYPAGWLAEFSVDQVQLNASGSPYDNATVILTITAGDDAQPGDVVDVVVEASQTTNRANTVSTTFTAIVGATFGIDITMDGLFTSLGDVTQGDTAQFGFTVWNRGASEDEFEFTTLGMPGTWDYEFGSDTVNVGAHRGVHNTLSLTVPLAATLGNEVFTLRGVSLGDPTKEVDLDLDVDVVANSVDGDLTILDTQINPDPSSATFEAGKTTAFQIPVESTFNVQKIVTMWWSITVHFYNATTNVMESWSYDSNSIPASPDGPGIVQGGGNDPTSDPFRFDINPSIPSQYGLWGCNYRYTDTVFGSQMTVERPTQTTNISAQQTKTFTFLVWVPGNAYEGDSATITVKATVLADTSKGDSATFGSGAATGTDLPAGAGTGQPTLDTTTLLLGIGAIVLVIVIASIAVGSGGSGAGSTSRRRRK